MTLCRAVAMLLALCLCATQAGAQTPTPTSGFPHIGFYMSDLSAGVTNGALIGRLDETAPQVWNYYSGNPVIPHGPSGSVDSGGNQAPTCVLVTGNEGRYGPGIYCYLVSVTGTLGSPGNYGTVSLTLQTSSNGGFAFTQRGLVISQGAFYDAGAITRPFVIYDTAAPASRRFKMWYIGYDASIINTQYVNVAFSPDGVAWTKSSRNPMLNMAGLLSWANEFNTVVVQPYGGTCTGECSSSCGCTWYLFFGAFQYPYPGVNNGQAGYATAGAPDGPYQMQNGSQPIVRPDLAKRRTIASTADGCHLNVSGGLGTVFAVGDVVAVGNGATWPITARVSAATASTVTVTPCGATNATAVVALCSIQLAPATAVYWDGTQWRMVIQCYQALGHTDGTCDVTCRLNRMVYAVAPSLGSSSWTIDYSFGQVVDPPVGRWDYVEADSMAVLSLTPPPPTGVPATPTPTVPPCTPGPPGPHFSCGCPSSP